MHHPRTFWRSAGSSARRFLPALLVAAAAALPLAATPQARADDAVDRVNREFNVIGRSQRSDTVLLPALAAMERPPAGLLRDERAAILPAGAAGWAEAEAWAMGAPQREVLRVLDEITKETDWRRAMAFGQPYGIEGVPVDLIRNQMYTELGDPPTLAAAQILYMPRLDELAALANVEATRLAAAGSPNDAIDVMGDFAFFARSMADREFYEEVKWGLVNMGRALERIRDIGYVDYKGERKIDSNRLLTQIERLSPEGYLAVARMSLPIGDFAGAAQLVDRIYGGGSGVNADVFAQNMSRLATSDHPLRLFSESAKWQGAAASLGSFSEARGKVEAVRADWTSRWSFPPGDRRLTTVTERSKVNPTTFPVAYYAIPDFAELFRLRLVIRTELVGTQTGLALLGASMVRGDFPPVLSAVRPRWITQIPPDPFNVDPSRLVGGQPPLEYFVPMRDSSPGRQSDPHEMTIIRDGTTFSVRLRDDTFVAYSHGSNNFNDFARRIQNTGELVQGADYLIWPPVNSLYRQHLRDLGQLK